MAPRLEKSGPQKILPADLAELSQTKVGRARIRDEVLDPSGLVTLSKRSPLYNVVRLTHLYSGQSLLINGKRVVYGPGSEGMNYYYASDVERKTRVKFFQGDRIEKAPPEVDPLQEQIDQLRRSLNGARETLYDERAAHEREKMRMTSEIQKLRRAGRLNAWDFLFPLILSVGSCGAGVLGSDAILPFLGRSSSHSGQEATQVAPPPRNAPDRIQIAKVNQLIVPSGISDAGLIFLASAPTSFTRRTDTLISNREVSRLLFDGQILGLGVSEGEDMSGNRQRLYHFTLPSRSNGETIKGQVQDAMETMTWPKILNSLVDTTRLTDDELKQFIIWHYEKTFQFNNGEKVELDPTKIEIIRDERSTKKEIQDVLYRGDDKSLIFNELRVDSSIPDTSAESNRDYVEVPRPLLSKKDRLLLWAGVEQDIQIPESFLKPASDMPISFDFKINGALRHYDWNAQALASSMRVYFETRSKGEDLKIKQYGKKPITAMGWAHFVHPDDQMAKWIVQQIITPDMTDCEKANAVRIFWQDNTDYIPEYGVEVNRPMMISLLREDPVTHSVGGGDCNNLSVGAATLYAAAGLRVGLAYADTEPSKIVDRNDIVYSSHVLTALSVDQLGESCETGPAVYTTVYSDGKKENWVLTEPQDSVPIGYFSLGRTLEVRNITEYDPVTKNLKP